MPGVSYEFGLAADSLGIVGSVYLSGLSYMRLGRLSCQFGEVDSMTNQSFLRFEP